MNNIRNIGNRLTTALRKCGFKMMFLALCMLSFMNVNAEIKFYDSSAADVKCNNTWMFSPGVSSSFQSDATISGFTRSLTVTELWSKVWHNNKDDYFKKVIFFYKADTWSKWSEKELFGGSWGGWHDGSEDQTWNTTDDLVIFTQDAMTPGYHHLEFYFKGEAGNFYGQRYLSNSDGQEYKNYKVKFTVPGFVGKDVNYGVVKGDGSGGFLEVNTDYSFKSYGWATCTATIINDDTYKVFSFTQGAYGSSVNHTKSGIVITSDQSPVFKIYFKPTEAGRKYTAKIRLSGTLESGATMTKEYTLQGSAYSGDIKVQLAGPAEPQNGQKAKLLGYLKSTGCNDITEYGFMWKAGSSVSTQSTLAAYKSAYGNYYNLESSKPLSADDAATVFEYLLGSITLGTTYYYRAYASGSTKWGVSEEGSFTVDYKCLYPDPVDDYLYVTVDNSPGVVESECDLRFRSIKNALDAIKNVDKYYDITNKRLLCNVVFNIKNSGTAYTESTTVTVTGGKATDANCIKIEDFNNNSPDKKLILRGGSKTDRAVLQHLVIRKSKNITVEYLKIEGRGTAYGSGYHDNAMDIDNGNSAWLSQLVGDVSNANINIKGCYITSYGFACLHISAYDGITIEDCDIKADFKDTKDKNSYEYGSSIKLIHSKNIKLLRNSFRGAHSTSVWVQGSNHVLLMNNVFWNENLMDKNVAFVRLVCQEDAPSETVSNVGIYYNTFYLASHYSAATSVKVDFFRLGSWYKGYNDGKMADGTVGKYDATTTDFKYNNCYSYDEYVAGRNADSAHSGDSDSDNGYPFLTSGKLAEFCGHIDFNNFWSKYDEKQSNTSSAFKIEPSGCTPTSVTKFINVEDAVCKTASSDPNSLVLKTDGLNMGGSVTKDVSGMGAEKIFTDRLHSDIARPVTSTSGGGTSSAGDAGANGTIVLNVNQNITTASKDIDLSCFNFGSTQTVTCTISGTDAAKFRGSHTSFTTDASGNLSTKVYTVTLTRTEDTDTPYVATLTFSCSGQSIVINLIGHSSSNTPITGGWTLGAYQMSHGEKIHTIYWTGAANTNDWDNRNNWAKENGDPLTCVDLLASDLSVVIPAPTKQGDDDKYPRPESGTITKYPIVPEDFNSRESAYGSEIVNAGQGVDGAAVTKFTSVINMQCGAAIKGVEHLAKNGIHRYDEVTNEFVIPRKKWIIVGTVVKPFSNAAKTEVRNIKSGDYYMYEMPQVYMHESKVTDAGMPSWNISFSSLDMDVEPTKVFAIYIPDQYGQYKLSAANYKKWVDKDGDFDPSDADASKLRTFTGWFQNDRELPTYSGLDDVNGSFVSNTYPANLDIAKLRAGNSNPTIYIYNSSSWDFDNVTSGEVLSQSGFFVKGKTSLTVNEGMYNDTDTRYRSAEDELPFFSMRMINESTEAGGLLTIKYDELKNDVYIEGLDATKLFIATNGFEHVPAMYAVRYAKELCTLHIPTLEEAIPLGVQIKQKMTAKFKMIESSQFGSAKLTDVVTGAVTDLLTDTYSVTLDKGEYENRFFLNLKAADNIPTAVKEEKEANDAADIFISYNENRLVISSTPSVTLEDVHVTDMSGRTYDMKLKNAHYNEILLKGAEGVYIINVVGDVTKKTEKVIIK